MNDLSGDNSAGHLDRRRVLQAGAAGAVVVGAVASGAPSVLGLTSSAAYAQTASTTTQTTTAPTTLPPNTGLITVFVAIFTNDGNGPVVYNPPSGTVSGNSALITPPSTTVTTAVPTVSGSNVQWGYFGITPGSYVIDLQSILSGGSTIIPSGYSFQNWTDTTDPTTATVHGTGYQASVTVTAGATSAVYLSLVLNKS